MTGETDRANECACCSEGFREAGEMEHQEPYEVQYREMPSPAPGEEKPHIPV